MYTHTELTINYLAECLQYAPDTDGTILSAINYTMCEWSDISDV